MNGEQIGMLVCGCVFALAGVSMIASQRLIEWSLTTRRGERWVRWFGEQRGAFILRFIVGPLILVISCVFIWALLTGKYNTQ
jgi:hypothetical protein